MAEGEGFEPSRRFPAYTLSRRASSTTPAPLRILVLYDKFLLLEKYTSYNIYAFRNL